MVGTVKYFRILLVSRRLVTRLVLRYYELKVSTQLCGFRDRLGDSPTDSKMPRSGRSALFETTEARPKLVWQTRLQRKHLDLAQRRPEPAPRWEGGREDGGRSEEGQRRRLGAQSCGRVEEHRREEGRWRVEEHRRDEGQWRRVEGPREVEDQWRRAEEHRKVEGQWRREAQPGEVWPPREAGPRGWGAERKELAMKRSRTPHRSGNMGREGPAGGDMDNNNRKLPDVLR
jgi:hypothetical protein